MIDIFDEKEIEKEREVHRNIVREEMKKNRMKKSVSTVEETKKPLIAEKSPSFKKMISTGRLTYI